MRRENEHEPFLTVNAERWVALMARYGLPWRAEGGR